MPAESTYSYRARDKSGQIVTGSMPAVSADQVGERLREEGKFVLQIEDKALRTKPQLNANEIHRNESSKRVKREDVIAFCQQLGVMVETGVPLTEALDSFVKQTPRKEFRQVLEHIREDVCGGEPLSTSMARWPRVFPSMVIALMKASEASGTMAMMLGRIGKYLDKERRTIKQIKGAVGYPLFMMITATIMTLFLMTFVLPRFTKIYEMREATLPLPTEILMGVSSFLTGWWMWYVPAATGLGLAFLVWRTTLHGRKSLDWLRLNFPIVRIMYRQLYITRASRTLSTLLSAGVNLLDIIDICRGVTANYHYELFWLDMEKDIRDGKQMSDTVFEFKYIPPNVASMIASGERSGRLAEVMGRIAEFSEEELESAVKSTTAYIEPIMIIGMGLMIGGIAMALLLPIFSMGNVVAGG